MFSISVSPTNKKHANKKKMQQFQKRARAGMRGFLLSWTDMTPFGDESDVQNITVDHTNPTQRLIVADMWNQCEKWIMETEFQWAIVMRIHIETEKRGTAITECEFNFTCPLRGAKAKILNDAMKKEYDETIAGNNAYPEGHKNKGVFSGCVFVAKVAGV